jgi:hypothetical protein
MSQLPDHLLEVSLRYAKYEKFSDDLFRLTLSRENKAEIFEYALSKIDQNQHEASTMLQNLTRWDPPTAALFTLRSPATVLDTPFRLIFPHSALPAFGETGLYPRQYAAVSYCWHSAEFMPKGYERYGDWPISKPFVDAILEDKSHDRQGIWMDQLCIDQTSDVDKQRSVAMMDVIYRSCLRLLVLLEDVSFNQHEAALCERYDRIKNPARFEISWVPPDDEIDVLASCYHKINAARWWERAWCHHEFSVNEPWSDQRMCNEIHNATFIVNGPEGSTVKIKWYALHSIMVTALQSVPGLIVTLATEAKGQAILAGVDRIECEPGWRTSIMAKYNGIKRKNCLRLEDKVSVMINMCGIGLAYQGHSITVRDEVLYLSVLLAFAAGEAYPLTMFHFEVTVMFSDRSTWLQRHYAGNNVTIPKFRLGGLRGIHRVSMQNIDLDMIFLPPLSKWEIKDKNLWLSYEVFPETIPTTKAAHDRLDATSIGSTEKFIDQIRRRFIMSCMVQGHSFTARLWAQLKKDVVGPDCSLGYYKDLAPDPNLYDAARRFIAQLLPVSTLMCIPPPSGFTLDDAHLFLTWLTYSLSFPYTTLAYLFQCTQNGPRAAITGMQNYKHLNDGPTDELRAAVPTDLVGESCMPLRVWFLRPRKAEGGVGRWKLVGKALLLGEPDLMEEAERTKGSSNRMVYLERAVVGG